MVIGGTLNLKTEAETFFAVADHHSYKEGPVSSLLIAGQKPALVFEKETNTFAKRHHIRIWRQPGTFEGMPVWIGAGTHDIGIDFSRKERTFSHSVDGDIDQERAKIENDLIFAGDVAAAGMVGSRGGAQILSERDGRPPGDGWSDCGAAVQANRA